MKKILMLIMVSTGASLCAMDAPDPQEMHLNLKLMEAVGKGNLNEIQQLISAGASLNPSHFIANPLCVAIAAFRLEPQQRTKVLKLLLDNGARADLPYNRYNAIPLMYAAEYGTPQEVLLLLTAIPLDEYQYIKNHLPLFSKKIRTTGLISKDAQGLIQKQVIKQLAERQMPRIAQLLDMRRTDDKTARALCLENIYHREEIGRLLDLNNPESDAQIRAAVEKNIRRILFGPKNQ